MTVTIDTTSQRFTSGPQPEADVCVIHTTEGMNWPGYSGGGEAPHATIWPLPGVGIRVREHIPTTQYAKALMNLPGGVETNRRGVLQYELVGTCDPTHRGDARWYFWPAADPVVLAALATYLRPVLARYRIPHVAPTFKAYPASYGANGVRMSGATWNAFNGICGHENVPENDHGDPGAFPITQLIALLTTTPTPPAPTPEDDMLTKEAQDWIESRLDAHDVYVLTNLKNTMGRQDEARDAAMAVSLSTILSRLPAPAAK